MNKIKRQVDKVARIVDLLRDAKKEMESLTPYLEELVKNCDVIGMPAFNSKKLLPKDIFDEYHPGPKKTEEELRLNA